MLKRNVLTLLVLALAACSSDAPSDKQVKQALSDYYATAQGGADLKQALENEVAVGACRKNGAEYRCLIENKALGTSTAMFFVYDKSLKKWRYTKTDTQ